MHAHARVPSSRVSRRAAPTAAARPATGSRLTVEFSLCNAIGRRRRYVEFSSQHAAPSSFGSCTSLAGCGFARLAGQSPTKASADWVNSLSLSISPCLTTTHDPFGIPDARSSSPPPRPKLGCKCLSVFDSSDAAPRGSSILRMA